MTTPPIELAATVERVEMKEPECSGWITLVCKEGTRWGLPGQYLKDRNEAETVARLHSREGSLVRIAFLSPAPSPAETGAVPTEEVLAAWKLVESVQRHAAAYEHGEGYRLAVVSALATLAKALGVEVPR